jgi:hypothetical protein
LKFWRKKCQINTKPETPAMPISVRLSNKKYPLICLLFLLSSCATFFNSPFEKIYITTSKNVKVLSVEKTVLKNSSFIHDNSSQVYYVMRGRIPTKINVLIDSTRKTIVLKPMNSFAFWCNIENYGFGMLVDKNNVKRYAYQKRTYLSVKDTSIKNARFAPIKKGTIYLSFSPSSITIFSINTKNNQFNGAGIFGLETGIHYFYKDNSYLSATVGAASSRVGIVDHFGPGYFETGSTIFASVRNNNVVGSFDLGYGINLSHLQWNQIPNMDTILEGQSLRNTGVGLSLSVQYRFEDHFRLGILYQPNFWNMSFKPTINYQHYISLNLNWDIPIKTVLYQKG